MIPSQTSFDKVPLSGCRPQVKVTILFLYSPSASCPTFSPLLGLRRTRTKGVTPETPVVCVLLTTHVIVVKGVCKTLGKQGVRLLVSLSVCTTEGAPRIRQ